MTNILPAEFDLLLSACQQTLAQELKQCAPTDDPVPLGLVQRGEVFSVIKAPLENDAAKLFFSEVMAAMASETGAERLAFVAAAWLSNQSRDRPSAASDRREVVMVLMESRAASVQLLFPILRSEAAAPSLGDPTLTVYPHDSEDAGVQGRFARLLDRTDIDPDALATAREILAGQSSKTLH